MKRKSSGGEIGSPPVEITMRAKPSAALGTLAAQAELIAVRLVQCEFKFEPDFVPEDGKVVLTTDHTQYKAGRPTLDMLSCGVRLSLHMRSEAQVDAVLAYVFAEYSATYRIPSTIDCDAGLARRFTMTNCVHNVWPFFRELVHSMIGRTGLPAFVVPLFRMPPTHRDF